MKRARRHGFTLAETMITVAVISVMASMSMYGFDHMTRGSKQVSSVREIFMLVQEARSEARTRNQPVRFEVGNVPGGGAQVRWGRLPCADAWGRQCPSTACVSSPACGVAGCACDRRSEIVAVPTGVTISRLAGLCFVGSSSQPRGAACDVTTAGVTSLRFDLDEQTAPWLIVLEPLTGSARLVDCMRLPKDVSCP